MSQTQIQDQIQILELVRNKLIITLDKIDEFENELIRIAYDKYEETTRRVICNVLGYIMSDVKSFTDTAKNVIENANAINIIDIVKAKMLLLCAWSLMDTIYGILSRYELSELTDIAHDIMTRLGISTIQLGEFK